MAYWSIYVSPDEEKALKERISKIAAKKRWSFSQAVTGLLREHLIDEQKRISDEDSWTLLTTESFFEGYSEKDSAYDAL